MDELISKRAVIEAIEKARANVGHNLERSIGKSIIEILDDVGRDVNRLPSAEPTFDARDTQYNLPIGTDVISRQAAIDAVEESRRLNHHQDGKEACAHEYEHRHFLKILRDLPPAEPKRGKWERHYSRPNVYADLFWHCSECGYRSSDNWADKFNFCPNCGADMRGEQYG